jgi:DNA-binding response OmpR family regulator
VKCPEEMEKDQDITFTYNQAVEHVMSRILIVDDEQAIRVLYADELAEEGYEVITCGDGSRVLDLLAQFSPDVVVLDIKMGEYNGLSLLQDIRKVYKTLPVILCSAYSVFKDDMKSTTANDYVVKSSDLRDLKEKVKKAVENGMIQQSA